ncbi:uncharacterized protein LOC130799811 [Amaranthus tricolor]|uniref:uncharacterized protein LOC130799809 n=1 Tax=Amaranthus tricolor TaxID=29722 RepID=UPI0025832401|nr:uncharacterized protein LOC130799809 [Amaranthus tricolor]XP_057519035.1 uncharacterized protein LOC130799811 [Amaranthus tricolor]
MPINNNQASMHYPFEPNSQSQDNNCKVPDIYTNSKTGLAAPFREQDQYMPIAIVVRIMRRALPPQAKVADEAKELLQGCVSEFISFITSEANKNCQLEHRKTITAEDVIGAMSRLGFEHYLQPLSMYRQKYRESETLPTAVPRRMAYFNNDVNAITSTTSVMPPFALVHPHYAMIATLPSVSVGNGPNLGLRSGDGSGGSDGAGPSESPQDGFDFFYTYDKYK